MGWLTALLIFCVIGAMVTGQNSNGQSPGAKAFNVGILLVLFVGILVETCSGP